MNMWTASLHAEQVQLPSGVGGAGVPKGDTGCRGSLLTRCKPDLCSPDEPCRCWRRWSRQCRRRGCSTR